MLVITVRVIVKAGYASRFFERVLVQATTSLRCEPDCLQFDVCRDVADPHRVFLYEVYSGEPAFAVHLASGHFVEFDAETGGWVESKHVERWSREAPGRTG